jgi:hypothetical protein
VGLSDGRVLPHKGQVVLSRELGDAIAIGEEIWALAYVDRVGALLGDRGEGT